MLMSDVLKYTRSQEYTYTLSAGGWSGSAAPFTYTLYCPAVTNFNNVEVLPSASLTVDQYKILAKAAIMNGTQANGSITLKAYGKKPTVAIPIVVIVRGGLV